MSELEKSSLGNSANKPDCFANFWYLSRGGNEQFKCFSLLWRLP